MDNVEILKNEAADFANTITLDPELRNYQPSDFDVFSLMDGTLIAMSSKIRIIAMLKENVLEYYYKCTDKVI